MMKSMSMITSTWMKRKLISEEHKVIRRISKNKLMMNKMKFLT